MIGATPAFGARDLFVRGRSAFRRSGVPAFGWTARLAAEAHALHDADGAFEPGRALNLSASLPINGRWSVALQAVHFAAGHPAFADADKGGLILECR